MKLRFFAPAIFSFLLSGSPGAWGFNEDLVRSVKGNESSYYTAPGGTIGTFIVHPSVELLQTYDDNIYRETEKEGDFITEIRPAAIIQTDWSLHEVKAGTEAKVGRYAASASENYDDYSYFITGRYDVDYETYFTAELRHDHKHEDRNSLDDPGGDEPVEYDDKIARFGFIRDLSILRLYVQAAFRSLNFENSQRQGLTVDNSGRNRDQSTYQARLAYGLSDNVEVFVDGKYNERRYETSSESFRNSWGYDLRTGMAMNFSGKARGDVYFGRLHQNYDGTGFENINAFNYGGSLLWNITDITSLRAGVERDVQETSLANVSGLVRTSTNLAIEHSPRENMLFEARIGVNDDAYKGSGAASRDNKTYKGTLGVDYKMNPNMEAGLNYEYIRRAGASDYNNNQLIFSFLYDY